MAFQLARRFCFVTGLLCLAAVHPLRAAGPSSEQAASAVAGAAKGVPGGNAAGRDAVKPADENLSDAEHLARLQRTIEEDAKELAELKQQDDDPQSEYHQAESEFKLLDAQKQEKMTRLAELRKAGQRRAADALVKDLKALAPEWQAAKDRFDVAIEERKALREKAKDLTKKHDEDLHALEELSDSADADGKGAAAAPIAKNPVVKPPTEPAAPAAAAPAAAASTGDATTTQPAAVPAPPAAPAENEEDTKELLKAEEEAKEKQAAAKDAQAKAESVTERLEALRKSIQVEQELLKLSQKKADAAQEARSALDAELKQKMGTDPQSAKEIMKRAAEAGERLTRARAEVHSSQEQLDELHRQLDELQRDQVAALKLAQERREQAAAAEHKIEELRNPFTLHNLTQWSIDHLPKLLAVVLGALAMNFVVRLSSKHIVQAIASGSARGTQRERENRALTLVGVFRHTASMVILIGGLLMALDEVGIPIMPLLGGAAVFGLAVAFGAQNLIRDYFSGFMVLMEDQFGINDVVAISGISGVVEKITLRITVVRDLEGIVHFIPHGNITQVSNLTHGWSRAVLEVNVAYREDPDYVMDVLMDLAKDLRKDPQFGPSILDEPEMLGIDRLTDHGVVIKFVLKTHPVKRWPVRRELLRRIKHRFEQLGIEVPGGTPVASKPTTKAAA